MRQSQSDSSEKARAVTVLFIFIFFFCTVPASAQERQTPAPPDAAAATSADAQESKAKTASSPWVFTPLVSSSPKLGTSGGGLGAYATKFDPDSRLSLMGVMAQYTSTQSIIATMFARTSFAADHQRLMVVVVFGHIKNDYQDYLGTGQPLKTDDDLKAIVARYLYRVKGNWLIGAQFSAANYQVLGATPEDDLVLDTLGLRGLASAAIGGVAMHDSRDNEDMPKRGWYLNLNNLAYREALGGENSYDAYRADFKIFVPHGRAHVLAFRQFNWFTNDAPAAGQATVVLRGYKFGQYLAPYMSSVEAEERLSFGRRWGATLFAGLAGLYGTGATPLKQQTYPMGGAGLQFILKPDKHLLINLEYAQGIQDNRGLYLKLGYGW